LRAASAVFYAAGGPVGEVREHIEALNLKAVPGRDLAVAFGTLVTAKAPEGFPHVRPEEGRDRHPFRDSTAQCGLSDVAEDDSAHGSEAGLARREFQITVFAKRHP
jgi:hypothetical protein